MHVLRVPRPSAGVLPSWCASAGYREGWYTGYWVGGLYRVLHPPTHPLVLPGPNHCSRPRYLRPPGTPGARLAPSAHLAPRTQHSPLLANKGRDSRSNILKLVINPECHLKRLMRPAIVPISKTGSISHDLEFLRFPYCQPSLTRNKWSQLGPQGYFMVKTAKCRPKCTSWCSPRPRTQQYPRHVQHCWPRLLIAAGSGSVADSCSGLL